jgi:F-type H+-transporting ATPase subunit gamma
MKSKSELHQQKNKSDYSAMQMVSAAKLTRSEQNAKNFQVYAQKVRAMTTDLIGSELSEGQIIQC